MPELFMDNLPINPPSSFYVHTPSLQPRDQWTEDTPRFELAKAKPRVIFVEEATEIADNLTTQTNVTDESVEDVNHSPSSTLEEILSTI